MGTFKHFDLEERRKIERFLRHGKSLRWVAERLDRSIGSLSEEVSRNRVDGTYDAKKADHKAYVARKESKLQCLKVAMDIELKNFVVKGMEEHQSPEGLSGRLRYVEKKVRYASTKAIYKFVKSPHGRKIERLLYSKAV